MWGVGQRGHDGLTDGLSLMLLPIKQFVILPGAWPHARTPSSSTLIGPPLTLALPLSTYPCAGAGPQATGASGSPQAPCRLGPCLRSGGSHLGSGRGQGRAHRAASLLNIRARVRAGRHKGEHIDFSRRHPAFPYLLSYTSAPACCSPVHPIRHLCPHPPTPYVPPAPQLIIAHMCKEPLHAPLLPAVLLAAGAVPLMERTVLLGKASAIAGLVSEGVSALPSLGGTAQAVVLFTIALVWYSAYVDSAIRQICAFLGIRVLHISKPPASSTPCPPGPDPSSGDEDAQQRQAGSETSRNSGRSDKEE